uniref:Glycoprotein n=1 Tax=Miglotas virus TaxID=2800927 RepID=A0A894KJ35_9VIRU|nr:MAG: glycoprotein [Miglotas virus]
MKTTNMITEQTKSIHVTHGVVSYSGYNQCDVVANGVKAYGKNGLVPGWHYGLIDYTCDNITGSIASKMACNDCGYYCLQNQSIDGCQSYLIPAICGLIVGLVLTMVTRKVWKMSAKICLSKPDWFRITLTKRNSTASPMRKEDVHPSSIALLTIEAPTNHHSLNETSSLSTIPPINTDERTYSNPIGSVLYCVMIFGLGLNLFPSAQACDNTLFISSTGQICDTTHCREVGMYEMILRTGSVLCFRDVKGEYLKITLGNAYDLYSSALVYYTSDYEITTTHTWECKGAGTCWNGGCNANTKHGKLVRKDKPTEISNYGCDTDTLGCDTMCYYMTACTFYRWTLKSVGTQYPVYRLRSKGWMATVKVEYLNSTKTYTFDVNRPQINIEQLSINKMPMIIAGVTKKDEIVENSMIRVGDKFYNINAADINMPETGVVGDYQLSVRNMTATYPEHNVECKVNSCTADCVWPEPSIRRVVKRLDSYNSMKTTLGKDGRNIISKREIKLQANVLVGNVDIHNLKVSPAHCGIDVLSTFACTGCTLDSYAILQASNIRDEGMLHFVSDCIFDVDYLSCSGTPYKLTLIDDKDECSIHIPSTNQTVKVSFNYKYLGTLDPSVPLYSASMDFQETLSLMTTPSFMGTMLGSWIGFSLLSYFMGYIMRVIRGPGCIALGGCCGDRAAREGRVMSNI